MRGFLLISRRGCVRQSFPLLTTSARLWKILADGVATASSRCGDGAIAVAGSFGEDAVAPAPPDAIAIAGGLGIQPGAGTAFSPTAGRAVCTQAGPGDAAPHTIDCRLRRYSR